MQTVLSNSETKVIISPDHPFVMIGERINPTRRKKLAASMVNGDFSPVQQEAINQVRVGAQIIDVNAGIPGVDESEILSEATKAILEVVNVPLCFDSANPNALKSVLKLYPGKALINSTTAEEAMMDLVFPLAQEYHAAVIGVITDENGVPETPEARLKVSSRLIDKAASFGIPIEDIIIDPLALTVGADHHAARVTLESIRLIHDELGVNISLGASNVSFGLPDRMHINTTYLAMAIANGLTAAITDPTKEEISTTILASNLLRGLDEYSMQWLQEFRKRS